MKEKIIILKRKDGTQTQCPHCGKPITVKIQTKKKKEPKTFIEKLAEIEI